MEILKKSLVKKLLPRRSPESHKGENGRVLIVGGSMEFFGAPILTALGALYSGADLITILVPECNFDVSRTFYPDFIVRKYGGNSLNLRVFDASNPLLQKTDAVVIGPGLDKQEEVLRTALRFIERLETPVVIDADALAVVPQLTPKENRPIVITPHRNEFNALIEEEFASDLPPEEKETLLKKYAEKWQATILLKGPRDFIVPNIAASKAQKIYVNETGNSGMTVGGTGDVLAGIVGSFIAQGLTPFHAACLAAYLNGAAGDMLQRNKSFAFSATDIALELPYALRELS